MIFRALRLSLACTTGAHATDFFVTNTNADGVGSLRQALLAANADPLEPHQILFDANLSGTIAPVDGVSSLPTLSAEMIIFGPTSQIVSIDFDQSNPLTIGSGAGRVDINRLTFFNGDSGCLDNRLGAELAIVGSTYQNCSNVGAGDRLGGAINTGGETRIEGSRFIDNLASSLDGRALGGVVYFPPFVGSPSLLIDASQFINNMAIAPSGVAGAFAAGGAMYQGSGDLSVIDALFRGNQVAEIGATPDDASGGAISSGRANLMV